MIALLLLLAGLSTAGLVIGARYFDAWAWRTSLTAFRLGLSAHLKIEDVARWLGTVAAATHPPRFALLSHPPIMVEVVATKFGIAHYLIVSHSQRATLLAG